MSLIKCTECGKMVSDKAKSCPQCGAPIEASNNKMICSECGNLIDKDATVCPECGNPIEKDEIVHSEYGFSTESNKTLRSQGTLKILKKGKQSFIKSNIDIYSNNKFIGKYSTNEDIEIEVPIDSPSNTIEVKIMGIASKFTFNLDPHHNYVCELKTHKKNMGLYSSVLYDEKGGIIYEDEILSLNILILSFIIPIVGIIYFFLKKDTSPIKAKSALWWGLLGLLIELKYIIKWL